MTDQVPADGLHPNIARIAAAYDIILEQLSSQQLTVPQARAKIAQLEARDDQGVRWSIDPDSGQFVRKTALGAEEYDVPPVVGYQTHDAFSYTQPNPNLVASGPGHRVENPNGRLEMFIAPMNTQLSTPPARLAGATRNGPSLKVSSPIADLIQQLASLPTVAKAGLGAVVAAIAALLIFGLGGGNSPAPAPHQSAPTTHAPKHVPAHRAPRSPKQ